MGERLKIGLIFSYNEQWIAGSYYVMNLIQALKGVDEQNKPIITVISTDKDYQKLLELDYPYISLFQPQVTHTTSLLKRFINKGYRLFFKKNLFGLKNYYNQLTKKEVSYVFPVSSEMKYYDNFISKDIRRVYWIPDFQEKYYPEYFSKEDIESRNRFQRKVVANQNLIVFSSNNALNDFNKYYPENKCTKHVYQFSVFHPDICSINTNTILDKYNIRSKYFYCPNQFWQHKNHLLVLEALKNILKINKDIVVVFSGKESDVRNEKHIDRIKSFVENHKLSNNIKFLGFIPREDQIIILRNAVAVIQPSLFEGWSTVVEDCKLQNQYIILSNLPVHQEQIQENVSFFNPKDEVELGSIMNNLWHSPPQKKDLNYESRRNAISEDFIEFLKKNNENPKN